MEFAKFQPKINKASSSYGLKHQVEEWAGEYVSNGAFIYAAFSLDFPTKVIDEGPNVYFGIKLFTPNEKWKHIRPTGFSRWLFTHKKEHNIIGGLARDAISDKGWPRRSNYFYDFYEYLNNIGACQGAMNSLFASWDEYAGENSIVPTSSIMSNCEDFYETEETESFIS